MTTSDRYGERDTLEKRMFSGYIKRASERTSIECLYTKRKLSGAESERVSIIELR